MFRLSPIFRILLVLFATVAMGFPHSRVWAQEREGSIEAIPLSPHGEGDLKVVYYPAGNKEKERIVAFGPSEETLPYEGRGGQSLKLYTKRPEGAKVPSVFGRNEIRGRRLVFYPRFPLQPGVQYHVLYGNESVGTKRLDEFARLFSFTIPKVKQEPVATVRAVYPSSPELPENLLKFYIHFTHPMSSGDVYSHIRLLDEEGSSIELPFLELGEELWDRENLRLTLLFDPGRIKSGLMPRREEGAVLEAGKRYALQILDTWKDDQGRPLKRPFEKRFIATKPDGASPRVEGWKLTPPDEGTEQPLRIDFAEALDEALLQRVIDVLASNGKTVAGRVAIESDERSWLFMPEDSWSAGTYRIRVGTILEDLAGNSVGRPFEVDLEETTRHRPNPFVFRDFQIK